MSLKTAAFLKKIKGLTGLVCLLSGISLLHSQPEPLPYGLIANPLPDTLDQLVRDSLNINIGNVRVNQAGYRPQDNKWIYYVGNATSFTVINEQGVSVGQGSLSSLGETVSSSLSIRGSNNATREHNGDERYTLASPVFSGTLHEGKLPDGLAEGTYRVVVNADTSQPFAIHPKIYGMLKDALLKFYGIQRSGDSESWFHPPSHLQDGLPGGWYDCGDHLKEGITQSYAAAMLGLAAAVYPNRDTDHYRANHSQTVSPDGIPDILYELRHITQYVLTSYDLASGNIAQMITSVGDMQDHMWWGSPEYQEAQTPERGGPPRPLRQENSSPQFARFAAALASFSVGYRLYDSQMADKAIQVARELYAHAAAIYVSVNSPAYSGDNTIYDDMALAAVMLAWATKETQFIQDALYDVSIGQTAAPTLASFPKGLFAAGWFAKENGSLFHGGGNNTSYGSVQTPTLWALYKLILRDAATAQSFGINSDDRINLIEDVVYSLIKNISDISQGTATIDLPDPSNGDGKVGYNPLWKDMFIIQEWVWNRYQAGNMMDLFFYSDVAAEIEGMELPNSPASTDWKSAEVKELLVRQMDYMLGVNPWDISMVFGVGEKNFNHPHHRAANPEGKNVPGGFYKYRPPVGALQGSLPPVNPSAYAESWGDYFHSEVCLDGTTNLFLPTIGLAEDENLSRAPEVIVEIKYVGYNEAYLQLRQNMFGTSTLYYGVSADINSLSSVVITNPGVRHEIHLTDLQPGTSYYFYVVSTNSRSGEQTQEDNNGELYNFTTLLTPPDSADIQNVTVCNITHNSAEIVWYTPNGHYDSKVKWDLNQTPYVIMQNQKLGDDSGIPTKFHKVTIEGLQEQTTYYYGVESAGKIVTTDANGQPLKFTTPVEHVNFDLRTVTYGPTNNFFGIIMTNQDPKTYDSLELRIYITGTEEEMRIDKDPNSPVDPPLDVYELMARLDIGIKYNPAGFQDEHFKGIVEEALKTSGLIKIEDSYNPATGEWDWYFPISLGSAEMESGSRFRLDLTWVKRSPFFPYEDYYIEDPKHIPGVDEGDWSFRPHSRAAGDPADFGGVKKGSKDEDLDGNFWNLEINRYISVYRKGEFVWGYSPSAKEQSTKRAHYEINMELYAPFDVPNGSHIDLAGPSDFVYVSGWAHITEAGYVTDIWANGNRVPVTEQTAKYDLATDRWLLNIPVSLATGGNNVDVTIFAGPDPECAVCKQNGGCAFVNRSFFLEYSIAGRYLSQIKLLQNGSNVAAPFETSAGQQYSLELKDSVSAETNTAQVDVYSSTRGLLGTLSLTKSAEQTFQSSDFTISDNINANNSTQFYMEDGDSLWFIYVDPTDPGDSSRAFLQIPANFPQAQYGYLQDINEDGLIETIQIFYDRDISIPIDSINLPASRVLKPGNGDIFSSSANVLSITLATAMGAPSSAAGESYLTLADKIKKSNFNFAPIIKSARIGLNIDPSMGDTLEVAILGDLGLVSLPQFLFRNQNGDINTVAANLLTSNSNYIYLLLPPGIAANIEAGDWIKISGGISNSGGLATEANNPWAKVSGIPRIPLAKLDSGYYADADGNGQIDRMVFYFDSPIDVSRLDLLINWESEGIRFNINRFTYIDSSTLEADLQQVDNVTLPFSTGGSITAEDSYGQIELMDRAGISLLSAILTSPSEKMFIREGDVNESIQFLPDTLYLNLSEAIDISSLTTLSLWQGFFLFQEGCLSENPDIPLALSNIPRVSPKNPKVIKVPVVEGENGSKIKSGDCVGLFPNASIKDFAENANSPHKVGVTGGSSVTANFDSKIVVNILDGNINTSNGYSLPGKSSVPVLNDSNQVVGHKSFGQLNYWFSPIGMDVYGNVPSQKENGCLASGKIQAKEPFNPQCYSTIAILSEGAYSAEMVIYDHLGKWIRQDRQDFGFCGELLNEERKDFGRPLSFLVWNQKDEEGHLVGSGVYLIKVKYTFPNGNQLTEVYRQGIAKKPGLGCP